MNRLEYSMPGSLREVPAYMLDILANPDGAAAAGTTEKELDQIRRILGEGLPCNRKFMEDLTLARLQKAKEEAAEASGSESGVGSIDSMIDKLQKDVRLGKLMDLAQKAFENMLKETGVSEAEYARRIEDTLSRVPKPLSLVGEHGVLPGQIWTVRQDIGAGAGVDVVPIAGLQYVYVLTNPISVSDDPGANRKDLTVEVLPVSINVEFANQFDVMIPEGNDILGVEFMIETEIVGGMLVSDLQSLHGRVDADLAHSIVSTHLLATKMSGGISSTGEWVADREDAEKYVRTNTGILNAVFMDERVLETFKKDEFENMQILNEPVVAVLKLT